ncbi:hypothetical protein TWF696_003280 [Orbilia brochopaga]|uniref:Uncharacterized protein n=1 Tax=Orbilia brochopaga TaxID=3140254 RepID=A0AAV9TY28_9PEZI
MTSEGQEPSQTQQPPSRPASVVSSYRPTSPPSKEPSKEPSQTPKAFTPVLDNSAPDISEVSAPPTKRRSLSPLPPSAQGDTFQSPFNASFHSHSLPPTVNSFTTAPAAVAAGPEGPSSSAAADPNKQQNPRPYNRPGFKMQNIPGAKIGAADRKPSLSDDGALIEAIMAKDEERKRNQSIVKPPRKGSRAGESHRRMSSGGLTTIPYIPKGFRNIMANEPAQTPLMQAIHNPISLDTGPPSSNSGFGSSGPRMQSPHQSGPPKLGLNTQLGSRTGTPEPGSSATPTTGASPGSPMSRRKSRAPGDLDRQSQPGSAKPRARQRSILPKSASIQFESVPYPYPNSESTVFVQVSPRTSTTSIQFQPPLVPYAPPMPPGHSQLTMSHSQPAPPLPLPPPRMGSPPPGPGGHPSSHPSSHHGVYMSPIGPPPPPPPPFIPQGYPTYGMNVPPPSPSSAQSPALPPPYAPPRGGQIGSGNPFSGNGSYHPPEFRPIDYGHARGPQAPLPPRHDFSPIMSNAGVHPDGLRKALFPQHERPLERKQSITRTTPFSGPPSTFMDEVTSPTASQFHGNGNLTNFERRDQPIVAPKSPSPAAAAAQQQGTQEQRRASRSSLSLGPPLNFITQNVPPSFNQEPSSPHHFISLHTASLSSPTKEHSSFLPQPTTPPMARAKSSIDRGKSKTSSSAQRISISGKSQHPQSPITPKAEISSSNQPRDNQLSPAAPMIKRRSAYVAGGGIKTTDLALPKPDVIELALSPEALSTVRATSEDPEQILTLNKPRKRNRANPSVLRTREKEVDASPEPTDDPDGQLTREMNDAEPRDSVEVEEEREMRGRQRSLRKDSKEQVENQRPMRKKRAVKNKLDLVDIDADDEEMEDAPRPIAKKRGRKAKQTEAAPSPVSEYNSETEEEEPPLPAIGKRTRKATTRAIKGAEQFPKRRRTRKVEAEAAAAAPTGAAADAPDPEAGEGNTVADYVSATSGAESLAPEPPVVKKPGRRGRKPAAAKLEKAAYSTASDGESASDSRRRRPQLYVNGNPIKLPTPPPGVRKPGLVSWYRFRERPKFTESDEMLDTEHTIRRLKDRDRLHHLKTSVNFFNSHTLIDDDGWTDTEQELEKMGKAKPVEAKVQKTALWSAKSQISDAAFEKGFEQLERQGSVEPLSAADTPRAEAPPSRQHTNLSRMALLNDDVDTPMDDAAPSTAIATPMVELDLDDIHFKVEDGQEFAPPSQPLVLPHYEHGFPPGLNRTQPPVQVIYNHTERKRKPRVMGEARALKNITWSMPHMEGRSQEILKQTLDLQAERRKEKAKAEAEAQAAAAAEDANKANQLNKPKRGGRRGKKKTKGDLKNLAYAREVRRAKLEGAKIHTPDDDNLSVVSGSLGGDGGDAASDATLDDDDLENSDHESDWSPDEEMEETPEMAEMEQKYAAAMADPTTKQFLEEWGPKLFPPIYELPEDATRNRGPEYTDVADFSQAIDLALEIDDQDLLQSVMAHTVTQYAMLADEKQKLENYQVKRGFIKPEQLMRRLNNVASKRKADDAGIDDIDEASAPRYSTRRRTVKNPDADDMMGMTGYSTPRVASSGSLLTLQERNMATPEREPRVYKPRGGRGRGGGRGAAKAAIDAKKPGPVPGEAPTTSTRGGRGRGGRGRGRGRGRHVTA